MGLLRCWLSPTVAPLWVTHLFPPLALPHAGDSAGGALAAGDVQRALSSSADLAAALDDMRSGSSAAALQDELAEKNRIIEQLQVCGVVTM